MFLKKILLIDDDKDDQLFFVDALEELNSMVQCAVADNGARGIDILKKNPPPPDIIFLDLNMPVMNGFECLGYIRQHDDFKKIPVVIFSTSSNPSDRDKAAKLGAKLFITKPSDFSSLKAILKNTLSEFFQ